ncbi:MAG: antiterminator Q family protein [Rouxiella aceris]|uniref:antiterminator Q family protein n=1 Tax=Rouxiella aceris TaxID=2703884 RepID=UPI0028440C0D|nr:antiterminator Q family protein [Rouxiella aceris]MDR3431067.1 antiterminator Q family protein [Rouxiella aceris]
MRDIQLVLERWCGWAASDSSCVYYSPIAAGFKGLLPQSGPNRLSCTDDDGLVINSCMAMLKKRKSYDYELIVSHYIHRISKRSIAKIRKKDEKIIRIEMQIAEGFIAGCLCMLEVNLDMDLEVIA